MKTQEILTIIALSALGLCLLCGLAKMAMKNPKKRSDCDKACGALFFVAVALMAVGQLLGETHTTSGFEMGAEGKKPENCVMKASSVADEYKKGQMAKLAKAKNDMMKKAKEIHDKELASCKAGGHSKHHHSNEITCEDDSGMCGKTAMASAGFEPTGVDLCYKNVANRSRADAAAACMQLGEDSMDGCATMTYNSLGECKRVG
jgi:hypothetical protein